MGRRQVSTDIGAPADRVFDLYTDAQRVGEWQTGVKSVESTGPLSEVGSKWTVRYAGPFAVKGTVLAVERPARHQQRFSEMLGLVDCTTAPGRRSKWRMWSPAARSEGCSTIGWGARSWTASPGISPA
jgi:hypothetical protein